MRGKLELGWRPAGGQGWKWGTRMLGREGAGPGTITGCGSQAAHVPGSAGQADSLLLPIAPDDQAVGLVTDRDQEGGCHCPALRDHASSLFTVKTLHTLHPCGSEFTVTPPRHRITSGPKLSMNIFSNT